MRDEVMGCVEKGFEKVVRNALLHGDVFLNCVHFKSNMG